MSALRKRHYNAPPVTEAVYEINVEARPNVFAWNEGLTQQLKENFPDFTQEEREQLTDHLLEVASTGAVGHKQKARGERIRCWNHDRSRLIQFGPTLCAFNALKQYQTFEDCLPQVRELFRLYIEGWIPHQINWAGQRYINTVLLPVSSNGADYFAIYPKLPPALHLSHPPLAVQVETGRFENGIVAVNLVYTGPVQEKAAYTLDIYARSVNPLPVNEDSVIEWQVHAHDAVSQSFELSITDLSRKLFEETDQ
jgi:uncharacterized protein (TIGR04255 family)